ncbi:bifunctional aspartokinase/homoserine dehydrogenase I [Phakopsora pachyrhizi]|uniref:aspartate kinase n=1 Tax=Phakopsora pachyrhizi TaxID=170000 RepID=A0AAV0AFX1_PHAPC|nr:bifunctional aspartokinase/homoserine dehydrogenase I [Phakopsora pachyrhizi]CAH7666394.1 bifunctional aspartokinase/homoserine dehydrogenase I [Phakopsora pachyrhizi]
MPQSTEPDNEFNKPIKPPLRSNPELIEGQKSEWVVQKFGGTSVGKFLLNIPDKILPSALDSNHRVALVCSARSGDTKSTGTTNLLLQAALQALEPIPTGGSYSSSSNSGSNTPNAGLNSLSLSQIFHRGVSSPRLLSRTNSFLTNGNPQSLLADHSQSSSGRNKSRQGSESPEVEINVSNPFDQTIELIRSEHLRAALEVIKDPEILSELECGMNYDCERLRSLLLAAQILEETSPRSKDLIVGVGERLSCRLVTACLMDNGFDAEFVCLDSIIDKSDLEAVENTSSGAMGLGGQLRQPFYDRLASKLGERILQCENRIPVITGFFGVVPGSLLTQVGRGYTDLCASLCAVGLKAVELQVWKEVDGIFTADPRKVPKARLLSSVTPEEAAELTYYGSEVIHPFTMEQVISSSIPIRIKNVMNPQGLGTVIYPTHSTPPSPTGVTLSSNQNINSRLPTAVTIKDTIVVLNIHSKRKTISHGFFANIFGILDRFGIVVDLISTSEVHVSMAIMLSEVYRKKGLDKLVRELKEVGEVSVMTEMAILSLVGRKMKNMVGIAGKMFSTLAEGNVNIEMISQGASEINISCVISEKDSVKALNLVHDIILNID